MHPEHSAPMKWPIYATALLAALFLISCGQHADPASKPKVPPPPPFEFVASWGEKGDGPGKFIAPVSFASDALGDLYFADPGAGFVHKFQPGGTPLLSFEDPRLRRATGIAVDAGGAIYVDEAQQGAIHVFFPDGTFFQTWHSGSRERLSGTRGFSADEEGT